MSIQRLSNAGQSGFRYKSLIAGITPVASVPVIGEATAVTFSTASVTFTAPGAYAGSTYTATSSPGGFTGTSASSPITVSGLSGETAYTFTVTATNATGTSGPSAASNSITTPAEFVPESGYDALATVTLASAASSISFTGIPGNYKHLQLRVVARSSATGGTTQNLDMRINDDSSTSYTFHQLQGNGSAAGAYGEGTGTRTACIQVVHVPTSTAASNIFGVGIIDILDYASTNKNKTVRTFMGQEQNSSDGVVFLNSMLWTKSVPVTKLEFYQGSNNLTQNTTIALYGVK
jgi:hypothetical protein